MNNMENQLTLKIYDTDQMFKAVLVNKAGEEKEIYISEESLIKLINKFSSLLDVEDFLKIIDYGDEFFQDFYIDTEKVDSINLKHLIDQLDSVFKIKRDELKNQTYTQELKNELYDNLKSDLAASVFNAAVAQMLVFILNIAKDISIDKITFSSRIADLTRFKKIVSNELSKYGLTLV
jgi:hypothetical protein